VLVELAAHLIVVGAMLGAIRLLEYLMERLWGHELVLFDRLKIQYVFDAADLVILVVFTVLGSFNLIRAYVREP